MVKAKSGKTLGEMNVVKTDNIYKALPTLKPEGRKRKEGKGDEKHKQKHEDKYFYCEKAGYIDCLHDKEVCPPYQAVAPRQFVCEVKEEEETDSDLKEEQLNKINLTKKRKKEQRIEVYQTMN